jgi:uncharacterized protein HemY
MGNPLRDAEDKCQDVAVWGTIVLLIGGFIVSVFIAPAYTLHDNGVGGTYATRTFNWQLFTIVLIGVVLVISIGMVGMHVARAIREMHEQQRESARAAATQRDTTG